MKTNIIFGVLFVSLTILSSCAVTNIQNHNWEYKVITIEYLDEETQKVFAEIDKMGLFKKNDDLENPIKSEDYNDRVTKALNELGKKGWELINVNENTYTFRRLQ